MPSNVQVELVREVDRERLLTLLEEHGTPGRPLDDDGRLGVEIACDDDDPASLCDETLRRVESWLAEAGLPLVPVRDGDAIFLRPPGD